MTTETQRSPDSLHSINAVVSLGDTNKEEISQEDEYFRNRLAHRADAIADIIWDYTCEFGDYYDLDMDAFMEAEPEEQEAMKKENKLYEVLEHYTWAQFSISQVKELLHTHKPLTASDKKKKIAAYLKSQIKVEQVDTNLLKCEGVELKLTPVCDSHAQAILSFWCPECEKQEKYSLCNSCKDKWFEHQTHDMERQIEGGNE